MWISAQDNSDHLTKLGLLGLNLFTTEVQGLVPGLVSELGNPRNAGGGVDNLGIVASKLKLIALPTLLLASSLKTDPAISEKLRLKIRWG